MTPQLELDFDRPTKVVDFCARRSKRQNGNSAASARAGEIAIFPACRRHGFIRDVASRMESLETVRARDQYWAEVHMQVARDVRRCGKSEAVVEKHLREFNVAVQDALDAGDNWRPGNRGGAA